jgi:hypothetical protein
MRHICLGQPEKSAPAEYRFETGHNIGFSSAAVLCKAPHYMGCLIEEAIDIWLHPRNFNRDGCFNLICPWYPVTNMIKQHQDKPIQKQDQGKQTYYSTH